VSASEGAESPAAHAERTFVFIDLAGFTALTAAHGDDDAAHLIDRFEDLIRSTLPDDAEFVKSIGDEAMLAFGEIGSALDTARMIFEHCVGTQGLPIPRGGAFHGVAVTRSGDYLGGCVNTAARIADLARSGQFLVGDTVAEVAREHGLSVTHLGDFRLRNMVEPVPIYEVHLVASERLVVDPVCRMRVDEADAIGVQYQGTDYWLCSLACAERFNAAPRLYASSA
jgi:class 3 adenylate cyclase/YHS domain-containing protein